MAEQVLKYYKVQVDSVFQIHNLTFRPGQTFRVSPAIYNDSALVTADGRTFKNACVSAVPEYERK